MAIDYDYVVGKAPINLTEFIQMFLRILNSKIFLTFLASYLCQVVNLFSNFLIRMECHPIHIDKYDMG